MVHLGIGGTRQIEDMLVVKGEADEEEVLAQGEAEADLDPDEGEPGASSNNVGS